MFKAIRVTEENKHLITSAFALEEGDLDSHVKTGYYLVLDPSDVSSWKLVPKTEFSNNYVFAEPERPKEFAEVMFK